MFDALTMTRQRARQYEALGLDLPKDVIRLVDIIQTAVAAASRDSVPDIDYDALTTKNVGDVLRAAAIARTARDGMQEIVGEIGMALWGPISRAFTADADRVTTELRPRFLEAAATVSEAIPAGLTVDTYANASKVIAAGPQATALFHRTKDALATLTAIRSFLHTEGATTVATFLDLTDEATTATLSHAEGVFAGLGGDEKWLTLYAVPGVTPALHTRDQAEDVARRSQGLADAVTAAQHAAAVKAAQAREEGWLHYNVPNPVLA